ncbi:MAG: thioredoxin family protein [Cohaesibacter sp.]|nr:thioredoxin family protein [Cohaesibacter sp.]MCV6600795.1 thioredoxin family protein [Cohaesibacter sp.]
MTHILSRLLMLAILSVSALTNSTHAKDEQTLELVMVEEAGCLWCERWLEEIGPIYPKTDEGKRAPLRRIDISDPLPKNMQISRRFLYTPTFILMQNGQEKGRIEGYPGDHFFWGLLAQMLASVDKKQASSEN